MKYSCCSLDSEDMLQLLDYNKADEKAIDVFKLLAHPIRAQILKILVVEPEICTCELTDLLNKSQSTNEGKKIHQPVITKQLTHLRKEGILISRKITFKGNNNGRVEKTEKADGKWTAYSLAENRKQLITYLLKPFLDPKFQSLLDTSQFFSYTESSA